MKTKSISLKVSSAIGSVSGEYTIPDKSVCVITLAHGAGAGMHHPFMTTLARSLAENGIATLRFNFPFTENKKGRPDVPAVAHKAIEAAINDARKKYPSLPLFISGKSFGGRMSSQYLSTHHDAEVKGIIFYGFPLHAPGNPSIERAEHLKDIKQPMLFLSGTRDEFASLTLLEKVCSSLSNATLTKIEGANHGFKAGKLNTMEILGNSTKDWITKII
ncbi:MAG TPA: alpha/beta family hydrolase [Chitinophagales bacterium]|nr:alpha/beta family hydrolase [Chitinophagales bacterium]